MNAATNQKKFAALAPTMKERAINAAFNWGVAIAGGILLAWAGAGGFHAG